MNNFVQKIVIEKKKRLFSDDPHTKGKTKQKQQLTMFL